MEEQNIMAGLAVKLKRLVAREEFNSRNVVFLPQEIATSFGFVENSYITVKAGIKETLAQVQVGAEESTVLLSDSILKSLLLYEGAELCVTGESGNLLRLGPVVGVFVNCGAINHLRDGAPGFRLTELMKGNRKAKTLLYYFSIKDLNWPRQTIDGYTYRYDLNQWEKRAFPLPDILYDRGGGFLPSQLIIAKYIRKQFAKVPGLKKLNYQHYFNKWDVYSKLAKYAVMKGFLPETRLYDHADTLKEMLSKYSTLYIKSCEGSNGKEVMRVIKGEGTTYLYSHFHGELVNEVAPDFEALVAGLKRFFQKKKFIVQQAVDVFTCAGKNVDMRVLCQRDATGEWQITDLPVRWASDNCPITSTKSGSHVYEFSVACRELFGYSEGQARKLKNEIRDLVLTAIKILENEYGAFGELGIDIAMDKKGALWFIEANAKPGKDTIVLSGNKEAREKAFYLPLEYARYLAEFVFPARGFRQGSEEQW